MKNTIMKWVVIAKGMNGDKIVDKFDNPMDAGATVCKIMDDPITRNAVVKITIERMWFNGD